LGVLAALVASVSIAQSVNVSANVSWVAPVNDANGLPLAGSPNAVTSYNVYASTMPLTAVPTGAPLAVVTAPSTAVSGSITAAVGDTVYVYVTSCNPSGCSGLSSPGTKLVTAPAALPGVPTSVTITVTVTPAAPH
jgi:hypothetical protein